MRSPAAHTLKQDHLASPDLHARPRLPLPVDGLSTCSPVPPPALIKGYLRCGGTVLGPPAWDPDFGTADFPMMLRLSDLPASYRGRFVAA